MNAWADSHTPVYDFTSGEDVSHTLWVIDDDKTILEFQKDFEATPYLYIADGHHRSAAAALVGAEKAKQNVNHTVMKNIITSWLFASLQIS